MNYMLILWGSSVELYHYKAELWGKVRKHRATWTIFVYYFPPPHGFEVGMCHLRVWICGKGKSKEKKYSLSLDFWRSVSLLRLQQKTISCLACGLVPEDPLIPPENPQAGHIWHTV